MAVQTDSTGVAYVYEDVVPLPGGWILGRIHPERDDRPAVAYLYENVWAGGGAGALTITFTGTAAGTH